MFNNYCIRKKKVLNLYGLLNSSNQLYNQIVKYSLYNCTTIIGENVRYFMNKYDIFRDNWNGLINILFIIKFIYIVLNIPRYMIFVSRKCVRHVILNTQIYLTEMSLLNRINSYNTTYISFSFSLLCIVHFERTNKYIIIVYTA